MEIVMSAKEGFIRREGTPFQITKESLSLNNIYLINELINKTTIIKNLKFTYAK